MQGSFTFCPKEIIEYVHMNIGIDLILRLNTPGGVGLNMSACEILKLYCNKSIPIL